MYWIRKLYLLFFVWFLVVFCEIQQKKAKNNKNFPQIRLLRSLNLMQKTDKTRISTNTSTDCHDIVKIGVISVLKEASIGQIISHRSNRFTKWGYLTDFATASVR